MSRMCILQHIMPLIRTSEIQNFRLVHNSLILFLFSKMGCDVLGGLGCPLSGRRPYPRYPRVSGYRRAPRQRSWEQGGPRATLRDGFSAEMHSLPSLPTRAALCLCVSLSLCVCLSLSLCLCLSVSVCVRVCVCVSLSISLCVSLCVSLSVSVSLLEAVWPDFKFRALEIFTLLSS